MGLLLRETLRTLCGGGLDNNNNHWSYAVFWKIGCQNANLLIWEDCYYKPLLSSGPLISGFGTAESPFVEWEGGPGSGDTQTRDKVHALINRMMSNNRINLVGEGMIGRAAFTGNYEWFTANNYIRATHPPEVLNEVLLQFSAGIQTVAVIPVLPHGVIQLGSSLTIMENMGYVNEVKSLILQLGCVSGALFSENYGVQDFEDKTELPGSDVISAILDTSRVCNPSNSTLLVDSYNQQTNSYHSKIADQNPPAVRQNQDNFQVIHSAGNSKTYTDNSREPVMHQGKFNHHYGDKAKNGTVGAEVIPSNPVAWLNQRGSSFSLISGSSQMPVNGGSLNDLKLMEQQMLSYAGLQEQQHIDNISTTTSNRLGTSGTRSNGPVLDYQRGFVDSPFLETSQVQAPNANVSCRTMAGNGLLKADSSTAEAIAVSNLVGDSPANNRLLLGESSQRHDSTDMKLILGDSTSKREDVNCDSLQHNNIRLTHQSDKLHFRDQVLCDNQSFLSRDSGSLCEDVHNQAPMGDDLFDVLGIDLKGKLLGTNWSNLLMNMRTEDLPEEMSTLMNIHGTSSDIFSANEEVSVSEILNGVGTDHLLDAVVSGTRTAAKQISDDSESCKTTLTKISGSAPPSSSPANGRVNMSDQLQVGSLDLTKAAGGTLGSSSFLSGFSKEDTGTCSQSTSLYGSQISSWVEQAHNVKRESSVSTAYSKRNDETTKSNRKRLKPGENPRPRPKDRQMIQDRVKELREIVPNGGKCSIDALFERTIKHMLFLQSVMKHADKLKNTGESKIVDKEGRLLVKDNFEGGATWAYEVGSQSTLCPIIVEDLNPPRQLLVEILCEERGFFLEIADLIRGLGLTILKGVMETRNDKVWARFAVEANRDVKRMEILMSLVHLLDQTMKGSGSSTSVLDCNDNKINSHSFPQASSIPATGTGRVGSLQ